MGVATVQLNPLEQINPAVIGAAVAVVVVTYFVLRKLFFLPYIAVMDERATRVEAARALREEARGIADNAAWEVADIESKMKLAVAEAERGAEEQSAAYHKDTIAATVAEIDESLKRGRLDITADAEKEAAGLRTQAIDCVGLACEQLLTRRDSMLIESAVDRALARPE